MSAPASSEKIQRTTARRTEVMLELVSETVDREVDVSALYAVLVPLLVRYHRRQADRVPEAG